jgi:hypothetical protein
MRTTPRCRRAPRRTSRRTDDAGVTSVLATFSLACAVAPGQSDEVTGCVRYEAQPASPDASVVPPEPGYDAELGCAGWRRW